MNTASDHAWHTRLLEALAARMRPAVYLELGVGDGYNLARVRQHCESDFGVDKSGSYFTMTTDAFFAGPGKDRKDLELTFIDADHRSEQAFRDFCNAFERTVVDGLVCLHDTWPENEAQKADGYCSDSYKVPEMVKKAYGDRVEVLTLPFPPGITIVRRLK